ncbi:MAG TPA: DUF302 domain-containing protein [Steroidobacteraceae bacterium]|nr:DUF302 domain-containing protein [Steroidobacteraceae bacterium]
MSYYIARTLDTAFDATVDRVIECLKTDGFGVLSAIDVSATLQKKLEVGFPKYRILGACNPSLAHKALTTENKIGTLLPCNVIVRDTGDGRTEVAAVDPITSLARVGQPALEPVAADVRQRLERVLAAL